MEFPAFLTLAFVSFLLLQVATTEEGAEPAQDPLPPQEAPLPQEMPEEEPETDEVPDCQTSCEAKCDKLPLDCEFIADEIPVLCDGLQKKCRGGCEGFCACQTKCGCTNPEGCGDACSKGCKSGMEMEEKLAASTGEKGDEKVNFGDLPVVYKKATEAPEEGGESSA